MPINATIIQKITNSSSSESGSLFSMIQRLTCKDGSKQPLDKLCRVNWSTSFEINLANNFTYTKFA
ncbi:hypothetical protein AYP76_02935 [Ligilactobacillus agilis]|uniref:Uncharacterized protein n=1 Tax=Ligilactobacillus agilis TaxID=1601 RepID=A0A231QPU7_9LACO|nr:hypothetical protein AYP75_06610 [Ligilactobacillus agilis]OXC09880.1 hypothetical protein AYP74_00335 [Ligilactobacillus agilis]OXC10167.1 hypothetical protein AYP76_02935 [Ligilactobacillus agilis]OXS37543.1 hypothetical protein AYP69_10160 [Ligilactobacillus agilis]OXS38611.1 hypothetical protein AYP70_07665 [Ligilactobacillus agilis]